MKIFGKKLDVTREKAIAVLLVLVLVIQCAVTAAPGASASSGWLVVINTSEVNVRNGAGTGSGIVGKAARGCMYDYISEKKASNGVLWYQVRYSASRDGWISSQYCGKHSRDKAAQASVSAVASGYGAVGAQVAIIENGKVTETFTYGKLSAGGSKMTADAKFRAASLSKVAVTMNVMKLCEEGRLSLDTKIASYWGAGLPKPVTMRSLLTHTSTLMQLERYPATRAGVQSQITNSGNYTSGTVGTTWAYNNYGVGIAGTTAEIAINRQLDDYAHEKFFNGLGIDASFRSGNVRNKVYASTASLTASAMQQIKLSGVPGNNASCFAGGLTISAKDYAKLIAILVNDGTYDGKRYLSAESVAEMEKQRFGASDAGGSFRQCMPLRYRSSAYGQSKFYYHTGNAYGVLALASYNPDTRRGVVVMTNDASQTRDADGIYAVCSVMSQRMYEYMDSKPIVADKLTLSTQSISLRKGEKTALKAAVEPAEAASQIVWSTSDPSCVFVSDEGQITALGHGTAVVTASVGGKSASCTVACAPELKLEMLGASVRVEPTFGMRFGIRIAKDAQYKSTDVVEYGTIVVPANMLGTGELTLATPKVRRIPAVYKFEETADHITYTGVLIDIPQKDLEREVVGRGYLIYADTDGTQHTIYTDSARRSFMGLAESAYSRYARKQSPTAAEQAMLEALAGILGIEQPPEEPDEPEEDTDLPADNGGTAENDGGTADTVPTEDNAGQNGSAQDGSNAAPGGDNSAPGGDNSAPGGSAPSDKTDVPAPPQTPPTAGTGAGEDAPGTADAASNAASDAASDGVSDGASGTANGGASGAGEQPSQGE